MMVGVSEGFEKKLKLVGVGYKAAMQGKDLNLSLGYAHQVILEVPQGLKVECTSNTEITVSGYDKVEVGNFAAIIRSKRKPEPYKGKGVRYADEVVLIKEGKRKRAAARNGLARPYSLLKLSRLNDVITSSDRATLRHISSL